MSETKHTTNGNDHLPLPKSNFGKKAFSYSGTALRGTLLADAHMVSSTYSFNSVFQPFLTNT